MVEKDLMTIPLISIVVPVYNVIDSLDRCVISLLEQDYSNIEIILIDDGSYDGSEKLCDEYSKRFNNIKSIHQKNKGLSSARNKGLQLAVGEYILFVDSDDYIDPKSCSTLFSCFALEKDIDFVVGNHYEVRSSGTVLRKRKNILKDGLYFAKDFAIKSIDSSEFYSQVWLNLYRKDFLLKNKLFFREGILYEDHEMMYRLFICAKRVFYIQFPFYYYCIRNNSIMTSKKDIAYKLYSNNIVTKESKQYISNHIEEKRYKRKMYGNLVRSYLAFCKKMDYTKWNDSIDFNFAIINSLNFKEFIKNIIFNFYPHLYIKL